MERISKCKLCGGLNQEYIFDVEDHYSQEFFSLVRCLNCGLIFTNPRPSHLELSKYYPDSYYGETGRRFHPIIEKVVQYSRKRMAKKIVSKFRVPGRILEIGSGRGTLLYEMAKHDWIAYGTEYSKQLVKEVSKNFGIRVYPTPNLNDCKFPDKYFNVVICFHVLEHMPEPIETLEEIRRIIHPNGLLIIAVPNIDGLTSRITRNNWFGIDAPRHLFHFTPDSLERSLNKTGFRILSQSTLSLEQDIFGFSQSILNKWGFPYNMFYDLIRSPHGRMRHKFSDRNALLNLLQVVSILLLGGILSILGLFITITYSIVGLGGTLEYWADPVTVHKQ
jgi:2-polyprenyl-3-methyl-5-hydroxy-6-metoxy-1,4-benzoquinol methylase